ncbi:hypothetical protein MMU07_03415 [Aquiflexum sp. LQ15W]|uniref:hypothetical protein n=1 Tax=Cognataquiflexum nitidum TaxID=2922272 RepID=UPI001F137081|nr:hypothetical protein [Cognataquiflexum nitidum]MCH6198614.1 hypothetical protein [Cognataquiflexum nitidum]
MPTFKITMTPQGGDEPQVRLFNARNMRSMEFIAPHLYSDCTIIQIEEEPDIFDKQVISATLACGRTVHLLGFRFHLTYSNLIEGEPDKYWNESILSELEQKYRENYMPTHIRRPSEDSIQYGLPVFYGEAEWACYRGMSAAEKSSELRVIWFMDSIDPGLTVMAMLLQSLEGLDWEKYAQRYDPGDL